MLNASPDQKSQERGPTKEVSVMAWIEDAEQKVYWCARLWD
jgi:hypothetical protein